MRRRFPVSLKPSAHGAISNFVFSWAIATGVLFGGAPAHAQTSPLGTPVETWIPNGSVSALALDGDVLFVSGVFDQVNPPTGTFATVDAATGAAFTTGANLAANVTAIAPDGTGGWFVATVDAPSLSFTEATIAVDHVLASGTVDPAWTRPRFDNGFANGLVLDSGRLFVGGLFTTVNGSPRSRLVALDPASGAVLPWTADVTLSGVPAPQPTVTGLATSPGRLYLSGGFSHVGGVARQNFAVVDAATGAVLPPQLPVTNGFLGPPAIAGNRVYVFGSCRTSLYEICAYDLDLVPLPGWTFPLSNQTPAPIAASDAAVFATYRSFDFPYNERTVRLDPATGVAVAWPEVTTTGGVVTLTAAAGKLYLAGRFTTVNGQERTRLAAVDAATGALDAWAPLVGGAVSAVSVSGGSVAFGGEFRGAGGIRKRNLVTLDLRTGRPSTPNAPDLPFAATAFKKIGGVMVVAGGENSAFAPVQPNLLAFSTTTGALLPWSLTTNGTVSALTADTQRLYLGGSFSSVAGVPRSHVAAVDLRTATLSAWNATADLPVRALAVADGALYAGGGFGGYPGGGGEPRNYVTAFDLGSGATLPFSPRPAMVYTSGLAVYQDRVLLVGGSADALEWVDKTSGAPVPPASAVAGSGTSAAQVGDTVFVTGWLPGNIGVVAIVDAPSGRIQTWRPQYVSSVIAANDGYVALNVPLLVYRRPGPASPHHMTAAVVSSAVSLGWQAGVGPAATSFVVEAGTSFGATDVGAFPVGLATAVTGTLAPGTYFTRVRGVNASGAGAASSEMIVTVPASATPPNAPGTLTASVAGGVVTLQWGAASGNATTYVVEAGTASSLTNIGTFATGHLDTSFTTAAPSGTYFVRVRAANGFGASAPSNEVTVVVP